MFVSSSSVATRRYADLAASLDLLAAALGKDRSTLHIWDPFYCAGGMKRHLAALGFKAVRNECADFYETRKRPPDHDVVVTNPPCVSSERRTKPSPETRR